MDQRRGNAALVVGGVALVGCLVLGMMFFSYNNSFVQMDEDVRGKWAQVDNQLKRRAELIPNLVETVKGYAFDEKEVFAKIAESRSTLAGGASPADKIRANGELTGALNRLVMVAEAAYPNLKADANFSRLMDESSGTENRLAVERQRYNESVQHFNTSLRQLPGSLVAGMLGFHAAAYFETPAVEKATPQVKF